MISQNINTDTVKRTCRNFNSFNFQQFSIFMNDNVEYLQVLSVWRRFCQLQINSPVMASLYIYKLKVNAKLQEKSSGRWDMSIHHEPTISYVNLQSQSFVFNGFISCHGWLKEVLYVTIGNSGFCFALYLTGVHFRCELQHLCHLGVQKVFTNQNSRNSWCQIVRQTICKVTKKLSLCLSLNYQY